jgi:hypothetical protein
MGRQNVKGAAPTALQPASEAQKRRFGAFAVAGAGYEPATSGLSRLN